MAYLRLAILLLSLLATACDGAKAPSLARIETVGPRNVEPGDVLSMRGAGFIEGACTVTLDGAFKPDGIRSARTRRVSVQGQAVSEQLIEVPLSSTTMKKIVDAPTTFNGKISVTFPVTDSAVRIVAKKEGVAMSLRPGGGGVAAAAQRLRKADSNLQGAGIVLAATKDVDGLVVQEVVKGSVAEKAGLAFGDRLLSVDGKPLVAPSDFSVVEPGAVHRLEVVSRMGVIRETDIEAVSSGVLDSDELTAVVLSCIALGLFLAFAAPSTRYQKRPLVVTTDPFTQALGMGIVSVPLAFIPALSLFALDGLPLLVCLFFLQGVGLAVPILLDTGRGLLSAVPRLLIIPMVVGTAGVLSSAVGLGDIVSVQQTTAYGPHVFAGPFAFLLVAVSVSMLWPSRRDGMDPVVRKWRSAATWLGASAAAATVTLCLLGGWNIPFVSMVNVASEPFVLIAGCLVFLVKTWLVILAARWYAASHLAERRRKGRLPDSPIGRSILLLLATVSTIAYHLWELSFEIQAAGHVIACALFVTFGSALLILALKDTLRGFVKPANTRLRALS